MTPAHYSFIRNLVANRSPKLSSAIAKEMADTQDLGRVRVRAVFYEEADFIKAESCATPGIRSRRQQSGGNAPTLTMPAPRKPLQRR